MDNFDGMNGQERDKMLKAEIEKLQHDVAEQSGMILGLRMGQKRIPDILARLGLLEKAYASLVESDVIRQSNTYELQLQKQKPSPIFDKNGREIKVGYKVRNTFSTYTVDNVDYYPQIDGKPTIRCGPYAIVASECEIIEPSPIGKDRNGTDCYKSDSMLDVSPVRTFRHLEIIGYDNDRYQLQDMHGGVRWIKKSDTVLFKPGPNNPNYRGEK